MCKSHLHKLKKLTDFPPKAFPMFSHQFVNCTLIYKIDGKVSNGIWYGASKLHRTVWWNPIGCMKLPVWQLTALRPLLVSFQIYPSHLPLGPKSATQLPAETSLRTWHASECCRWNGNQSRINKEMQNYDQRMHMHNKHTHTNMYRINLHTISP